MATATKSEALVREPTDGLPSYKSAWKETVLAKAEAIG
jgi:hypothetical protein